MLGVYIPSLPEKYLDIILNVLGLGVFLTVFGFLSRRLARSARTTGKRPVTMSSVEASTSSKRTR